MTLKGFSKGSGGGGAVAVLPAMTAFSCVKKLGVGTAQLFVGGTSSFILASRVEFANGEVLLARNAAQAVNRVTIATTGVYAITFNSTLQHGLGVAARFQSYIGRNTALLAKSDLSLNTGWSGSDILEWVGPLNAGDLIDFRVGSNDTGINVSTQAFCLTIVPVPI